MVSRAAELILNCMMQPAPEDLPSFASVVADSVRQQRPLPLERIRSWEDITVEAMGIEEELDNILQDLLNPGPDSIPSIILTHTYCPFVPQYARVRYYHSYNTRREEVFSALNRDPWFFSKYVFGQEDARQTWEGVLNNTIWIVLLDGIATLKILNPPFPRSFQLHQSSTDPSSPSEDPTYLIDAMFLQLGAPKLLHPGCWYSIEFGANSVIGTGGILDL